MAETQLDIFREIETVTADLAAYPVRISGWRKTVAGVENWVLHIAGDAPGFETAPRDVAYKPCTFACPLGWSTITVDGGVHFNTPDGTMLCRTAVWAGHVRVLGILLGQGSQAAAYESRQKWGGK